MEHKQLNLLDRAISWFAPQVAVRRLNARATLQRLNYAAASSGRRTAHWRSTGSSANTEVSQALPILRDRARELLRNNPLARKAVSEITTRAIGTGIQPQPRTNSERVNKIIESAWSEWVGQANSDGQLNYYGLQRLLLRSILESGEALYRKRTRRRTDRDVSGKRLRIPFQIQTLESDFLDHSKSQALENGYIINGVEFNALGKRVAYWMFDAHPGDTVDTAASFGRGGGLISKRVPAEEVQHGYIVERPGQVRGVPLASSVLLLHRDLDDTADADLMRRKTAACFGVAFESPETPDVALGNQTTDTNGDTLEELGPGMILRPKPGEKVSLVQPPDAPGLVDFMRMEMRMIAAGWNIPYEVMTGDLSQINYSSYRGGLIGYRDWLEVLQWDLIIPFMCDPAYFAIIDMLALMGEIPMGMTESGEAYRVEWGTPKFDLLDRAAEAEADDLQLANGSLSWPDLCMRQGIDPRAQAQRIADAIKMLRDLGIEMPWMNGAQASAKKGLTDGKQKQQNAA